MDLFEETERLKIRFLAAYERLHARGLISDAELQDVMDALDRLDELSVQELTERLARFQKLSPSPED